MPERSLDNEAQFLKGVGPKLAPLFAKLGLHTVGDVLRHLPRRYEDRRNLPPISKTRPGDWATVRGVVRDVEGRPLRGGKVLIRATVVDRTGSLDLTWFNQPWIRKQLEALRGEEVLAYGMVRLNGPRYEMNNPEFEALEDEDAAGEFLKLWPVYPSTEGLPQKVVRRAIASALEYVDLVPEPLPEWLRREHKLMSARKALERLHRPEDERYHVEARRRLVFEEFFVLQLALQLKRAETHQEVGIAFPIAALERGERIDPPATETPPEARKRGAAKPSGPDGTLFHAATRERLAQPLWEQIHEMLPFELTKAQRRVLGEIFADMAVPHPMNRLVQGDVGSGKTAVAACAMLAAVRSGFQAAIMAPTEILAEQHAANLRRIFEPLGVEVELLVGKFSAQAKKLAAKRVAEGAAHLAVGTHALIQEHIAFRHLGLVVIDEQHRFGVLQRAALRGKGLGNPDVLVMTATPIPRTLTMTMYGDLDVSIIDELPPGRKPIRTLLRMPSQRDAVYLQARQLIDEGRQVYVVCPMISESETMNAQAATEIHGRLQSTVYADLQVGLLHGQMKAKEKEEVMARFRAHELHVLVATTVIEVGVDVPNASVMIIEDAHRFGLSQLHQLRGRVGRGAHQSYCILIGDQRNPDSATRLIAMEKYADGFRIAEEDLNLRGPGELAGTRQSGVLDFHVADLIRDSALLEVARQEAIRVVGKDPGLKDPQWALLLERVLEKHRPDSLVAIS